MASTKRNLWNKRSLQKKNNKGSNIKKEENMSDNFYKQAAAEVLRDAASEKKAAEQDTVESQPAPGVKPQAQASELSQDSNVEDVSKKMQQFAELSTEDSGDSFDDFDFVEAYDGSPAEPDERMLPENSAQSAVSCAFIGVGGGGGKLAKAFLDLGFSKTLLVNTTIKDQPDGVPSDNFLLVPGADGVGKDVSLGKQVLENNSALFEDTLRTRIGKVDWVFVLAGGGGGTGSACSVLHTSLERHLKSTGASGKVVYIVSKPTAQELLNPTIASNCSAILKDIENHPHIVIDNEKQLQLLRGRVGMLDMYPAANKNFGKLLSQVLKLASENSPIQSFDSKDLEKCLGTPGRMVIGSTVARDVSKQDLGSVLFEGCVRSSPCLPPENRAQTGAMLLVATSAMVSDPTISKKIEATLSYVGGRTDTLFSGVYVKQSLPGLIGICLLGGM